MLDILHHTRYLALRLLAILSQRAHLNVCATLLTVSAAVLRQRPPELGQSIHASITFKAALEYEYT